MRVREKARADCRCEKESEMRGRCDEKQERKRGRDEKRLEKEIERKEKKGDVYIWYVE